MTWLLREKSIYFDKEITQIGCLNCDYLFLFKDTSGNVFALTKTFYCHLLGRVSKDSYLVSFGNRVLEVTHLHDIDNTINVKLHFIEFARLHFAQEFNLSFDTAVEVTQLLDNGFVVRSSLLGHHDHYFYSFEGGLKTMCEDCDELIYLGDKKVTLNQDVLNVNSFKLKGFKVLSVYPSSYPHILFFTEDHGYTLDVESLKVKEVDLSTIYTNGRVTYSYKDGGISIQVEDKELLVSGGNLHQMCCQHFCVVDGKVVTVRHLLHYQEEVEGLLRRLHDLSLSETNEREKEEVALALLNLDMEYSMSQKLE